MVKSVTEVTQRLDVDVERVPGSIPARGEENFDFRTRFL